MAHLRLFRIILAVGLIATATGLHAATITLDATQDTKVHRTTADRPLNFDDQQLRVAFGTSSTAWTSVFQFDTASLIGFNVVSAHIELYDLGTSDGQASAFTSPVGLYGTPGIAFTGVSPTTGMNETTFIGNSYIGTGTQFPLWNGVIPPTTPATFSIGAASAAGTYSSTNLDASGINSINGSVNAGQSYLLFEMYGTTVTGNRNFADRELGGVTHAPRLVLEVTAVPEPSIFVLGGFAALGLCILGKRRKK